jgi:hypothetical protein
MHEEGGVAPAGAVAAGGQTAVPPPGVDARVVKGCGPDGRTDVDYALLDGPPACTKERIARRMVR